MSEKTAYKNPPIVERIIGVYHKMPQDHFETKLPSWVDRIRDVYPVAEPLAEWIIDIESKHGVPFVKSLTPKARLIPVFWKRHPKHRHVHGMRLRPDRLVFHLCREEGNTHNFEELLPEMERWLPIWAEHFGISSFEGVTVEYFNRLNAEITPEFVDANGRLKVGQMLTIFGNFPGPAKGINEPYDCKVRLVIDEHKPAFLDVRVRGDEGQGAGVRVDLAAKSFPARRSLTHSEALAELRAGHDTILEHFACFFTDAAKLSFTK